MSEGRVAAGFYKGRALAGSEQYGTTKQGTEQLAIDIAIPSVNMTLTTFLYFTKAAAPYALERLRACGWKGSDLANLAGIEANEIDVQLRYETYDGKESLKCDIAIGGGRVKLDAPMSEAQKRAFAARMKAVIGGAAQAAQQRPPTQQNRRPPANPGYDPNAGAQDGDDIPF